MDTNQFNLLVELLNKKPQGMNIDMAALTPLITALAVLIGTAITYFQNRSAAVVLDKVHTEVNAKGTASLVKADAQEARILTLTEQIGKLQEILRRDFSAQLPTQIAAPVPVAPVVVVPGPALTIAVPATLSKEDVLGLVEKPVVKST